jgi:hypothetical protein
MFGAYEKGGKDRLGQMFIEVSHPMAAFALAQDIRKSIPADGTFEPEATMTMTRTMMATNATRHLEAGIPGVAPPRFNRVLNSIRSVPESEIQAAQALVTSSNARLRLDPNYRVLIVPVDHESLLRDSILRMKRDDGARICFYMCDGASEEDIIPQPVYVFASGGTVQESPLCSASS